MERESTKHGPLQDDELKHETRLNAGQRFASAHEVMVALGINAPEHRQHPGDGV
jgi:hypothetical protein